MSVSFADVSTGSNATSSLTTLCRLCPFTYLTKSPNLFSKKKPCDIGAGPTLALRVACSSLLIRDSSQTTARQQPGTNQTTARHQPDSSQTPTRQQPDCSQTPTRHTTRQQPDISQILARHLGEWYHTCCHCAHCAHRWTHCVCEQEVGGDSEESRWPMQLQQGLGIVELFLNCSMAVSQDLRRHQMGIQVQRRQPDNSQTSPGQQSDSSQTKAQTSFHTLHTRHYHVRLPFNSGFSA